MSDEGALISAGGQDLVGQEGKDKDERHVMRQ